MQLCAHIIYFDLTRYSTMPAPIRQLSRIGTLVSQTNCLGSAVRFPHRGPSLSSLIWTRDNAYGTCCPTDRRHSACANKLGETHSGSK